MSSDTLRADISQMVMPRLNGQQLDDPAYKAEALALARAGIGGFILFGGDIEATPVHLADLQSAAQVPLLITSDVERGLGQQLAGGTRFPGQRAVASAFGRRSRKDENLLHRMLDAVRSETRAAGIHAVFSPVMDVNNNPDNPIICTRAFGEDPDVVEWFGSRYIRRLQRTDRSGRLELLACAKHYPGHGDTDQDSHSVLPVISVERERLNRVELPPFREAVQDGVGMVMVAHLQVPALDPEKPVTFSKKTVTALLREGMEFGGLIVSDALDMGALADRYSQEEIAERAVLAGIDILLHPRDARLTIDAVSRAVEAGRLTHVRVRESAERILEAKQRLGLLDAAGQDRGKVRKAAKPDLEKHRDLALIIAEKVPQRISAAKGALPLDPSRGAACFILDDDALGGTGEAFLSALMRDFSPFSGVVLEAGRQFSPDHVRAALEPAGSLVLAIFSRISASKGRSGITPALRDAGQEMLRMAGAAGKRSAVLSFDSPYILDQFRDADVRIAAYDRMDEIQRAAAEMLSRGKHTG